MRLSLVQLCVGFALVMLPMSTLPAQAGTAPARSTALGVTLPTGTTSSSNFFYREAARYTLKLDATRQSVTLGASLELFRLPMTGAPQSEIVTMMRDAGWTVTIADSTPTIAIAEKAGTPAVFLSFTSSKRDRWLYTADIVARGQTPASTPADATPQRQVSAPPVSQVPATGPTSRSNAASQPAATMSPPPPTSPSQPPATPAGLSTFAFSTTKFDDGWTSNIGDSWVEIVKGDLRVIQHYKREEENQYMSVVEEQTRLFWNLLVAPRYRDVAELYIERNNPGGYEPINYAEATATDAATGRRVFVVLFYHPNRKSRWMEFITPDKATFEREFGAYRNSSTDWARWLVMTSRNRFAVSVGDFTGTWSDNFASGTSMVFSATGRSAGMLYAGGSTNVRFEQGSYVMDIASAEGMVGSVRTRNVTYTGAFTVVDNWTVAFANNFQGRTRRFTASFEGVKGGRVLNLMLDEPNGYTLHLVRNR